MCPCTLSGFNRSAWHALWVLVPVSGLIYRHFWRAMKGNDYYYFSPKHFTKQEADGDFAQHSQRYQDLARLIITLSAGAVAFLVNTLANEKEPIPTVTKKIEWSAPIVVGFFGSSIGLLIVFIGVQTLWYEQYCHRPKHDSYVPWKYAMSNALGVSGLLAFILGFIWLAANVFC